MVGKLLMWWLIICGLEDALVISERLRILVTARDSNEGSISECIRCTDKLEAIPWLNDLWLTEIQTKMTKSGLLSQPYVYRCVYTRESGRSVTLATPSMEKPSTATARKLYHKHNVDLLFRIRSKSSAVVAWCFSSSSSPQLLSLPLCCFKLVREWYAQVFEGGWGFGRIIGSMCDLTPFQLNFFDFFAILI